MELAFVLENDFIELESTDDSGSDSEIEDILFNCVTFLRLSIQYYFEETVQLYSEEEFIRHYRINRNLFLHLANKYNKSDEYQKFLKYNSNTVIKADKTIGMFLQFAEHKACSFRDLSDRFNILTSTVHLLIVHSIVFFSNISSSAIRQPDVQAMEEETAYRENRSRIPGIIGNCQLTEKHSIREGGPHILFSLGCVNGSPIQIDPPRHEPNDYINRKGK